MMNMALHCLLCLDLCQWKRKLPIKRWNSKDTPVRIFQVQLAMGPFLQTESSKLLEKPEKTILGPMLGQDRLQKNSGGCLVRSGEIPSPRQTSIDETDDLVMNSERSALGRGPVPP